MRHLKAITLAALSLAWAGAALAQTTVYQNNFETDAGGFSLSGSGIRQNAPNNSTFFLGGLALGSSADLTLTNLAPHTSVSVTFSLYAIHTVDGPSDPFRLFANGAQIFSAGFSNNVNAPQDYPNPGSQPGAGASATGQLGYNPLNGSNSPADATYSLSFTFADVSPTLTLSFVGQTDQFSGDEQYGIDNVLVQTDAAVVAVPGPVAGAGLIPLLGLGAAWVVRQRKRIAA